MCTYIYRYMLWTKCLCSPKYKRFQSQSLYVEFPKEVTEKLSISSWTPHQFENIKELREGRERVPNGCFLQLFSEMAGWCSATLHWEQVLKRPVTDKWETKEGYLSSERRAVLGSGTRMPSISPQQDTAHIGDMCIVWMALSQLEGPIEGNGRKSQQKEARGGCSIPKRLRMETPGQMYPSGQRNCRENPHRWEAPTRESAFTSAGTRVQPADSSTCSRKNLCSPWF